MDLEQMQLRAEQGKAERIRLHVCTVAEHYQEWSWQAFAAWKLSLKNVGAYVGYLAG